MYVGRGRGGRNEEATIVTKRKEERRGNNSQFFFRSTMDANTAPTNIPKIMDREDAEDMSMWKYSAIILRDTNSKIAATAGRMYFICSTALDIRMYSDLLSRYTIRILQTH